MIVNIFRIYFLHAEVLSETRDRTRESLSTPRRYHNFCDKVRDLNESAGSLIYLIDNNASRDYVFGGKYKKLEVSRIYVICFKIYSLWKENHDHKIMRANWNIKHNSCLVFDAIWRLAQFWPYFLVMQKSKMTKKIQCKAWESFIRTYKSLSICPFN